MHKIGGSQGLILTAFASYKIIILSVIISYYAPASPADMALRLAPPQSDVLNIDEHELHWLEALHGDGLWRRSCRSEVTTLPGRPA